MFRYFYIPEFLIYYFTYRFRVRKDGWLLYPESGEPYSGTSLAKKILNYCVDGAQDYGESQEFSNLEQESILFLCSGGVEEGKTQEENIYS
jgi:hypothetical protein